MGNYRTNLLCWYPFKESAEILEISATESCFSDDRKIRKADLSQFKDIKGSFDYIVLNDVFRLAPELFLEDPHVSLLKACQEMLKKNGHILLTIENRFGLKYFAGEPDLLYKKSFLGMNPDPDCDLVLFTKKELELLISAAGFKNVCFYYPYPNHLEPFEIFTDQSINKRQPSSAKNILLDNTVKIFDDGYVNEALSEMDIAQYFTDSFLVDISN